MFSTHLTHRAARTLSGPLLALAGATALAQTAPPAPGPQIQLVPEKSEVVFVSRQMGQPVQGSFKRYTVQGRFDPRQPATSQLGVTIDLGSVSLPAPEVVAELPKPEWFDTARFPQASFQSSSIKALGSGRFEATGKLNIKGQTQTVTVPVALSQAGGLTTASGSFAIKRLAFRIGAGEWGDTSLVADEVQVRFKLALTGIGPM